MILVDDIEIQFVGAQSYKSIQGIQLLKMALSKKTKIVEILPLML